jgi:hypothetical protein
MIITDLELKRELTRAANSGRYLITISYVDVEKKEIKHFTKTDSFPREDIPATLNKLVEMLDPEIKDIAEDNS